MRKKQLFNDGWKFVKQKIGTKPEIMSGEGIDWYKVEIPHDWLIYDTNDLYETGEGWYKKTFTVERIRNRLFSICFEGVYMDTTVYVNGRVAGEWKYGYSSFEFDITELLKEGENEIMVRVVHQAPNSRWYSGAGIYRNVWLQSTEPTHIVSDGIYISAKKDSTSWQVEISTEVISKDENLADAVLMQTVYDREGNVVQSNQRNITVSDKLSCFDQCMIIHNPILWDIRNPYVHVLKTELIVKDIVVDEVIQNFGFRTLRFDHNEGFFLNNNYVKLHGACEHHDLGCLGAAMNKTALRRKFVKLQEMGVNAIRTSHNMPAVELMELADEMGMLIVSEAFDMWERQKTEYDYARFFPEWHERDVASWIRRDRNHPSIIMWSIGNEIYDTHASERGVEVTRILRDLVLLHDPKQNGIVTIGSNYMAWENAQKCAAEVPAAGYNYAEYLYEEHHKKYPDWIIYGSETSSTVQSRGIYHFPVCQSMLSNDDEQCSSLGNCTTSWGAKSTEKCIIDDRDARFCLGQFIWTGFDYIGEPTPYFTKNSYFGQLDTAGFEKDSFYIYQAEWTDYKVKPMIHILPYWDFNEGQLIDIRVYSNAPRIELFFNDNSLGAYEIDHEKGLKLRGDWQLPYHKGTLRAVAYDELGNIIAEDIQRSFGDARSIVLKPDKTELKADGQDLIFVTISTIDQEGKHVANANNRVEVEVSGAGRLIGLDNGDSTDYDSYKGTNRRLFSGKLLAVIAAKYSEGDIKVKVTSLGLEEKELLLKALKTEIIAGSSDTLVENIKSEPSEEIPIRKINLVNHGTNKFNEQIRTTKVTAQLCPSNASYDKIKFRITNAAGIDSHLAEFKVEGNEVSLTAKGDGRFYLRCYAFNGKNNPDIISDLEFDVTGLGVANMNPYEFITGGLYNASNTELGNGNERGVATLREAASYVGYRGLDFGEYGSDEVTIPIFYLGNDPLPVQLWEGMPDEEGSELLVDEIYHKPMIWNVYQEQTFKLPRRMKGITTLCIVLHDKAHIKGFRFAWRNKAYELLSVRENSRIYGDTFRVAEDAIEHIGNNVSIEFDHMNFGEQGLRSVKICGRSHIDVNTLHIRFQGDSGDINQIVEFPYSEDYIEQEFKLKIVKGECKVTFVFMPGSKFDMKWFQFNEIDK